MSVKRELGYRRKVRADRKSQMHLTPKVRYHTENRKLTNRLTEEMVTSVKAPRLYHLP